MLTNIDCNFIKIDLSVSAASYNKIAVVLKKNCCDSLTYLQQITVEEDMAWKIKLFNPSLEETVLNVTGFSVKNILTGIEEKITGSEFSFGDQNCTLGFTDLQNNITTWFTDRGFMTSPAYTYEVINNICYFEIQNLPYPYTLTKMTYTEQSTDKERMFEFADSSTGFFISGTSLYLSPAIFENDSTAFESGIYTVEVTMTKPNGTTLKEDSCLFMDCGIKCQIADKLDTLTNDHLLHVIYFALLEASNCSCQCDKLCSLYKELLKILGSSVNDCGCE